MTDIPLEIVDRILEFADRLTLSTFLRASKVYCQLAAPRLYRNVLVTPQIDLLYDTGLPANTLTRPWPIGSNKYPAADRLQTTGEPPWEALTLKRHFLSMIQTVDVESEPPSERPPGSFVMSAAAKRAMARSRFARELGRTVIGKWLESLPPPIVVCARLGIHLQKDTWERWSPLQGEPPAGDQHPVEALLAVLQPRRLVVHGVGFLQIGGCTARIPSSIFVHLHDIVLVVTPGAAPLEVGTDKTLRHEHRVLGLPLVLDHISLKTHLAMSNSRVINHEHPLIDLTIILSTPSPRFPPVIPNPHPQILKSDIGPDGPDRAPGWLHQWAYLLGLRLRAYHNVHMQRTGRMPMPFYFKQVEGARTLRVARLVNFGSLDGEQVGMPSATSEQMQQTIEKGLRWEMKVSPWGQEEIDQDTDGPWLKFMTLDEWNAGEMLKGEGGVVLGSGGV